jgi:periplasmic copper chaperone A
MRGLVPSVLAAILAATPALAADLTVSDAWFRALPAKLPAAGYFTLHNGGAETVVLTGASSPACAMLMLHKSDDMNGMSSMGDVANIPVASGDTLKFAPGGYHLMCVNPTTAMRPGASVVVTLTFVNGAKLSADFAVKDARGK